MKQLIKIAWRNIWRNRLRSAVVITSILMGMWAAVMVMGLSFGASDQRLEDSLTTYVSHIQIHHPEFTANNTISDSIANWQWVNTRLEQHPKVSASCARTKLIGMIASPKQASGVTLYGIDPEKEQQVTTIHQQLDTGSYFNESWKNQLVIGRKLADKLGVGVRKKVVITFQDQHQEIVSAAFRIVGIYKTTNSQFDGVMVYAKQADLAQLLGHITIHEIAALTSDLEHLPGLKADLQQDFPEVQVQTWEEIAPELSYADDMLEQMLYIFVTIIILALVFGIINTMLMAVLERKRELGMLQAIGMNKQKLFAMILIETLFFALLGGPLGLLLSYLSISYFQQTGIDISAVAAGMESVGMGSVLYPKLDTPYYFIVLAMVTGAAILAAIYPARKALQLNPTESIRAL